MASEKNSMQLKFGIRLQHTLLSKLLLSHFLMHHDPAPSNGGAQEQNVGLGLPRSDPSLLSGPDAQREVSESVELLVNKYYGIPLETYVASEPLYSRDVQHHVSNTTSRWWDDRGRTTFCVNASAIIERVDEQLLPALYRFVGASFQARPAQLGNLTLARALAQAIASPIAGILGQHLNRITVLCCGATIWGAMTLGFSRATTVSGGLIFWAINGIGLSFLIPSAQSLTADYNPEERRGRAFGLLHMVGALGALLGALFATNIGHLRVLGMDGWRFAFLIVALSSWIIGGVTWVLGIDPRYSTDPRYRVERAAEAEPEAATWRTSLSDMGTVVTVPTFGIIVLQGIVGTTPWSALVFLTFYFQLLGMSDFVASLLMAVFLAANAAGGMIGGIIGDAAARRFPNHGRIFTCQFSVGIGVPLSIILLKGLPLSSSIGATFAYAAVLAVTGLLITWAATAANNPIFSEIVPPHMRNLIYAFDRSFEGAIAAAGIFINLNI